MQNRVLIAQFLSSYPPIQAILADQTVAWKVMPLDEDENDIQEISRETTPDAYDDNSDIKYCGMVIEDTSIQFGVYKSDFEASAQNIIRVVWWQQYGRAVIDELNRLTRRRLHDTVVPGMPRAFPCQWAGNAPSSLTDVSQRDAPMTWTRWQIPQILS